MNSDNHPSKMFGMDAVVDVVSQTIHSTLSLNFAVIATILGVVAVIISLWLFIKWFRRPMGARLKPVLASRENIAIIMHPNPDPDTMASAMGIAHIASLVDTDATILYPGQIRHQENRVFKNILDPDFSQIRRVDEIPADDVILVDHNSPRGFEGADQIMPIAVIDHHPGDGTGLEFTDKRTSYGACSSIVAEYLNDIGVEPIDLDEYDADSRNIDLDSIDRNTLPPNIATGLMYGIHADTNHLTEGTIAADFEAASYLHQGVDDTLLDRIANPEVDTEVLDIKARAIANREERGSFIVSNVGEINNVDAVAQAADELILLEGTTSAVVHGTRGAMTHVSGRSRDDRVHMGDVLESIARNVPDASAGGHARMGGGEYPIAGIATDGGRDGLEGAPPEFSETVFAALEGDI